MRVYRLSKEKFVRDLSGRGAELVGGRWNSVGVPMLYTSSSRALCVAEVAVHIPLGILPRDYCLTVIELPDADMEEVKEDLLPSAWRLFTHQEVTQRMGNAFVEEQHKLVLKVPSAVVQGDYNYLINPRHPHFARVKVVSVEKFEFDGRLFGMR